MINFTICNVIDNTSSDDIIDDILNITTTKKSDSEVLNLLKNIHEQNKQILNIIQNKIT